MRIHYQGKGFTAIWPLLALLLVLAGCGGDNGSDPTPEPDCSITGVNTSQQNSWITGATVNIRWTQNGVPGTVKIELLKAGAPVATIATDAANTGFYPWVATTGGQTNGADFGIRVTATNEAGCTAEVNGLTITDVTGCGFTFGAMPDSLYASDTLEITWASNNTSGRVNIALHSRVTGTVFKKIADIVSYLPDEGNYVWTIDSYNNADVANYRLVISDSLVADCEALSTTFKMVDDDVCRTTISGPTSSVPLRLGGKLDLQLQQAGGSGVVRLVLYSGEELVRGGIISESVSVLDDYSWTVTDFGHVGDNTFYRIRAIDTTDQYCVGETDRFTIMRQ